MSILSDEDSFVILGSTPTPSMSGYIEQLDAARSPVRGLDVARRLANQPLSPLPSMASADEALSAGASRPSEYNDDDLYGADAPPARPIRVALTNEAILEGSLNGSLLEVPAHIRVQQWQAVDNGIQLLSQPYSILQMDGPGSASCDDGFAMPATPEPPVLPVVVGNSNGGAGGGGGATGVSLICSGGVSPTASGVLVDGLADAMLESGGGGAIGGGGSIGIGPVSASFRLPETMSGQMLRQPENAELLQQSIANCFPSLSANGANDEDLLKLGSLLCEHQELKENLEKTNMVMRQHFGMLNQWQSNVQKYKTAKQREAATRSSEIAKLKDEILALNRELVERSEHTELTRKLMQDENTDLVQQVSNQNSMLLNMSNQIGKFEQEAHSFEMLSINNQPAALRQDDGTMVTNLRAIISDLTAQVAMYMKKDREGVALQMSLTQRQEENQATIATLNAQIKEHLEKQRISEAQIAYMGNVMLDLSILRDDHNKQISELTEQLKIETDKNTDLAATTAQEIQVLTEKLAHKKKCARAQDKTITSMNKKISQMSEDYRHAYEAYQSQTSHSEEMQSYLNHISSQLSSVTAENLEILDMKQIYIDQIQCLEKNLLAAEQQVSQVTAEHNSSRSVLVNTLADKDQQLQALQLSVSLLEEQLEIFRDDFQKERKSRQDMASEREEILSDLKLLQRRNEELMKSRTPSTAVSSTSPSSSSSTPTAPAAPAQVSYMCPVCDRKYPNLKKLESHVNDCLQNAE